MQNTYQEKILDIETTNNSIKKKLEGGIKFKIKSDFQPSGDQPQAIKSLTQNLKNKKNEQVLLGVTGSGKTFTMAKVIEATNRPALVLAPNKTLAAQLYGEFKSFFPENAVEYFVSYYDYYTPEAYVPRSDTYIENILTFLKFPMKKILLMQNSGWNFKQLTYNSISHLSFGD